MSDKIWNYFDALRGTGKLMDISTITEVLKNHRDDLTSLEIINFLENKGFFTGEYLTPTPVAKLCAKLGQLSTPNSIIDICCGIGVTLSYCDYVDDIYGIDINSNVIELAKMISPNVKYEANDFIKKTFSKKFDLIFGAFPFGSKIVIDNKRQSLEAVFIKKALSILKRDGVLISHVSNSFLFGKSFLSIRKHILSTCDLDMIINLPAGILPNTNIRSSILYVRNNQTHKSTFIYNYMDNDDEIIMNYKGEKGDVIVQHDKLVDRWDWEFHDPKFSIVEERLRGNEVKTLEEIAYINIGYTPKRNERLGKGEFLIIGGRNILDGRFRNTNQDKYIKYLDIPGFKRAILKEGDIIVSLFFKERKILLHTGNLPKAIVNNSCAIIRSNHAGYINLYLNTNEGKELFVKQAERATKGSIIHHLSIKDLRTMIIPILPIENLEKLQEKEIRATPSDELQELLSVLGKEIEKQQLEITTPIKELLIEISKKVENVISNRNVLDRIGDGESTKREFKSTLRYNIRQKKDDKVIENTALKEIVAFCNTDGGELYIGVSDDGEILGLGLDHFKNEDKFLLHLRNIIMDRIKPTVVQYVDYQITEIEDRRICIVTCQKSSEGIFLQKDKKQDPIFYVRTGPSSTPISGPELFNYIKSHFS